MGKGVKFTIGIWIAIYIRAERVLVSAAAAAAAVGCKLQMEVIYHQDPGFELDSPNGFPRFRIVLCVCVLPVSCSPFSTITLYPCCWCVSLYVYVFSLVVRYYRRPPHTRTYIYTYIPTRFQTFRDIFGTS